MRDRRIRPFDVAGKHVDPRQVTLVADPDIFEPLGVFGVGEELLRAELERPLERHPVFTFGGPLALEIRVAPRQARGPRRFTVYLGEQRHGCYKRRRRRQRPHRPSCHVVSPHRESTAQEGA
jgi:hypothetical protein